jgi:hypothetical protein
VILGPLIVWAVVSPTKGREMDEASCDGTCASETWFNHPNNLLNVFHILEVFNPIVI